MTKQGESADATMAKHGPLLDALLIDPDLEKLNARLSTFNIFKTLRIAHNEIRHSNVLAWLFDPSQGHGLGTHFMRRFLTGLLSENSPEDIGLRPSEVELYGIDNVEVRREWKNIDLLVSFTVQDASRWWLLIENKIHAGESKHQLLKYMNSVKALGAGDRIIPVFLTLEGDDPSDAAQEAGYLSWSHAQNCEVLAPILTQYKNRIPDDAMMFLNHYLKTIKRLTMQDEALTNLCKKIYMNHGEALRLILELGQSNDVMAAMTEQINETVDCEFIQAKGSKRLWFLPTEMGELQKNLPNVGGWPGLKRVVPIACWVGYRPKKQALELIMEVGPVRPDGLRQRFLRALEEAGFSFGKSSYKDGAKYTRVLSLHVALDKDDQADESEDEDAVKRTIQSYWDEFWAKGQKVIPVLKGFDWHADA